ncbi:LysM peptidoglycan-binding domain-containing protein [Evansella clarkii]|uniref:LysM peptidoglycan-binding domain-containing protein n=1 Tax=Evansella clarkii TaxID=79879 RepID=UPI0009980414|nr:LysM peptidoglycan-binding domain-containing protein [Evansella clarkii]
MRSKRTKITDKTSKKQDEPVMQKGGPVEAQADELGFRMLSGISIAAVIGSVLILTFFFSSDVQYKILAAKATPVQAERVSAPEIAGGETDSGFAPTPDLPSAVIDQNVSREEVVSHISRMSEEDFQDFILTITEKSGTEGESVQGDIELHVSLKQEDSPEKSDMMDHLNEMDKAEFDALINTLIEVAGQENLTEISSLEESLHMTIEDAYAEAEQLYPGQIDGSKRLKLVEGLNATGYMYYVAEEGDTLIKLSRAFHVPLGQLMELNGIRDADVIPAGMILLFPSDTEQPDIK